MEVWKAIPGYNGLYEVSSLGRVKSLSRLVVRKTVGNFKSKEKIIKNCKCDNGYLSVGLSKNGCVKTIKVHSLVAMAYLNHVPNGYKLVINHINHNKTDNRVENLEITTQRENTNQKHMNASSKYVGVHWYKAGKKWKSMIRIGNKKVYLGSFLNEFDAHLAYQAALSNL